MYRIKHIALQKKPVIPETQLSDIITNTHMFITISEQAMLLTVTVISKWF